LKLLSRYFKDLEYVFVTHHVSDDLEKKHAAVKYLDITVVLSSDNLASSCFWVHLDDFPFKVLISPEQQYTISGLQRLVSGHAHTQSYSDQELSKYYREFILISRNLITMPYIGVQEQVCNSSRFRT
jgi:hypothetical protein